MYKKLNYAIGDVASTTAIDATTLTLKAGHTITTDIGETNKFVAVFYDGTKSSPYQDTNREIVEAYRTDTNDFVIARAKEGTSAKQWIENDKFMLIASAGVFNEYETEIASKQDALGYTAENVANKKTNLVDNSDNYYPTQKAVKTALDAKQDTLTFGIANTNAVKIDDAFVADNDYAKFTANGIEGVPYSTVLSDIGAQAALGYTPENVANKETTALDTSTTKYPCNNVVKEAVDAKQDSLGYTAENVANKKTSLTDNSDTYYPTQKAVKTAVDAKQDALGFTPENVANKSTSVDTDKTSDTKYSSVKSIYDWATGLFQLLGNLVTSFQTTPDNTHYPSEKLVKDSLDTKLAITSKASSSEINTGTDDSKYITPDGLAGSNIGTKMIQVKVCDDATALTTGDGKIIFMIPEEMNGMNLVKAHAMVSTVSSSGTPTIQIRNVTDGVDMLSTRITIDASEYTSYTAATAPVIDTTKDDVATGDRIAIDVDSAGSGAKGLTVFLAFRLP